MKITLTDEYILIETETIDFSELRAMMQDRIAGFYGEYRWLSNFWLCDIELNDIIFPSVEHAYVYSKVHLTDNELVDLLASTPGQAKRIGKKAKLKADFDINKVAIMKKLLLIKFDIPYLQQKLLDTKTASLIEVNNWNDRFWGVDTNGNGLNTLGRLLEEVREFYSH